MQRISTSIMQRELNGINIRNSSLEIEIGQVPTLLVFLRHFGCIFCRELVNDLRALSTKQPGYPPILFFYQGTEAEGAAFFGKVWPDARAVADIAKIYYDAFGIERGGIKEMFGPAVWLCGVRAAAKGHFIGWKTGDPWTMPGMFLMQGAHILWQHDFQHAGDHPDLYQIPKLAGA